MTATKKLDGQLYNDLHAQTFGCTQLTDAAVDAAAVDTVTAYGAYAVRLVESARRTCNRQFNSGLCSVIRNTNCDD